MLSPNQKLDLWKRWNSRLTVKKLSKELGVSEGTVRRAIWEMNKTQGNLAVRIVSDDETECA